MATGPWFVTVIRQYAVAFSRPSRPTGACFAHGPTPPGPHFDAVAGTQISFCTVTFGVHAAPGATGSVTVLEVNAPVVWVPVAVFATDDTAQSAAIVVEKHSCGASPA